MYSSRTTQMATFRILVITLAAWLVTSCGEGGVSSSLINSNSSSKEPAVAPAMPDTEVANAAPDDPLTQSEAFRLLDQATFGPTLSQIEQVGESGAQSWINTQMQLPTVYLSDTLAQLDASDWNEYINAWWHLAISAEDQLRQRVAFALSEILVVSADAGLGDEQPALANYYDILLKHAFGNYRDLLEEVTLNPVMGEYLSMKGNRKHDASENIQPDENFAREVLQLFSIGLVQLNNDGSPIIDADGPLPTYDQTTIENFARVFTGWQYANADNFKWPVEKNYISPMEPWEEYHDTGSKVLLNGEQIPAGLSAQEDMDAALDNIFNHPNVGPFISKQLIQRLVTSNPSSQYVEDVAAVFNSNSSGERGSLASTVNALLMHSEARSGHLDNPDTFGKLKEPIIRLTQVWRAFETRNISRDFNYAWVEDDIGQAPLSSPSVFNYFRPDFSQPGEIRDSGLLSPEFQIHDETSIIKITNRLLSNTLWSHNYQTDTSTARIAIDISREVDLEKDTDALLDHLDLLLLGGRMTAELRQDVEQLMNARNYENAGPQRVVEAIFLIVSSPEAAIQI